MRLLSLAVVLVVVTIARPAAPPAKRPLSHRDYASWRSIQAPVLSPDGAYVVYALTPQEGDGVVVVRHIASGREVRHPRGSSPAAYKAPTTTPLLRISRPAEPAAHRFTPDGRFALVPLYPAHVERQKAQARGVSLGGAAALGILELSSGKLTRIERVRGYQVADTGPPLVAYLQGAPPATGGKPATRPGAELVVRHLQTDRVHRFADVSEYSLSRDGRVLIFAVAPAGRGTEVLALDLQRGGLPLLLQRGPGRVSRLTWNEEQTQLAFLRTPPGNPPAPQLWHWRRPAGAALPALPTPAAGLAGVTLFALAASRPAAREVTPPATAFLPAHRLSEQGGLEFSADGRRLWFGVEPQRSPDGQGRGRANVELWHYRDELIMPVQKVRHERDRQRTCRGVLYLDTGTARQLTDDPAADVVALPGDQALIASDRAHRRLVGVAEVQAPLDVALIDSRGGHPRALLTRQAFGVHLAPGGTALVAFDGKDWQAVGLPEGGRVNLTGQLGVSFADEEHDSPGAAPPYGLAGWTSDHRQVLLYDRYDVWLVALDGSAARNLTGGLGRKAAVELRLAGLDPNRRGVDPAEPLLVRAEWERTRESGFYHVPFDGEPRLLIKGTCNYGPPVHARDANRLLITVSTFRDFPDLFVTDSSFQRLQQVSDANPQRAGLHWGRAELIRYRSTDGQALQGVLIRPESFDPNRRYPLMVYIYERLSQNLHRFVDPRPGHSINPAYYASNGYLVLLPDIRYQVGHPGQSAVGCVLPAVQAVLDRGGVDENAIGIQGHSWGGYQTAYLITQTKRFRAAAAGAPVCNMTSAYGGIRWGTGVQRQFQYERTQSRIGATLWQALDRYLENSPLFRADRIRTPLLMLHNDRDEAVPWQQGIEFYLALRRLGRECYLFNYPGEFHGLRQRVNQLDYTVRLQAFFDHHLKGAPRPVWMERGEPYQPAGRGAPPAALPEP